MDDILCILSTLRNNRHLHTTIHHYIEHLLYDQENKKLLIIPQPDLNFLDSSIIIFNTNSNIKTIYNNKNNNCITTNIQSVGRFHHNTTPSHHSHKISAAQTIFIKIFDFTSHTIDMLTPSIILTHELRLLDYSYNDILSTIIKTNRTRPSPIWATIHNIILLQSTSSS
jgi:hypothetical protein